MKKLLEFIMRFFNNVPEEVTSKALPISEKKPYKDLLDLIAEHESKGDYDVVYGGASKGISKMTIKEVQDLQKLMLQRGSPSSAVGRYQFIRKTFNGLVRDLRVSAGEIFDEELQDKFALELLKRRGYEDFKRGKLSKKEFMLNLSKEWASFPVPYKTKGHKRVVNKGESYYAGDGLNKALVEPIVVSKALSKMKGIFS
jgi:muramidase (phage lysozyme)